MGQLKVNKFNSQVMYIICRQFRCTRSNIKLRMLHITHSEWSHKKYDLQLLDTVCSEPEKQMQEYLLPVWLSTDNQHWSSGKKAKCNNILREIYKHWLWFFCKEIMTFQGSITGSLLRIKIYLGCDTMLLPTTSLSQHLYAYITMTKFVKYFHHIKNLV